jgi:hypothetical protein
MTSVDKRRVQERRVAPGHIGAIAAVVILTSAPPACGRELIDDPGFEEGAPMWDSRAEPNNGEWYLMRVGTTTPVSRFPTSAEGGAEGAYVVSDQFGRSSLSLYQSFTVPVGAGPVILSYDMFVNDWSNQSSFDPSKHARVDLIQGDAAPFDVTDGVLFNAFVGADGGPLPNPFSHYEFDITPYVAAGGEFQIRFLTVNTSTASQNIHQGVDNVSVRIVPEPTTLGLALAAVAMWCAAFATTRRHPTGR